jgi:hypothetical protein
MSETYFKTRDEEVLEEGLARGLTRGQIQEAPPCCGCSWEIGSGRCQMRWQRESSKRKILTACELLHGRSFI